MGAICSKIQENCRKHTGSDIGGDLVKKAERSQFLPFCEAFESIEGRDAVGECVKREHILKIYNWCLENKKTMNIQLEKIKSATVGCGSEEVNEPEVSEESGDITPSTVESSPTFLEGAKQVIKDEGPQFIATETYNLLINGKEGLLTRHYGSDIVDETWGTKPSRRQRMDEAWEQVCFMIFDTKFAGTEIDQLADTYLYDNEDPSVDADKPAGKQIEAMAKNENCENEQIWQEYMDLVWTKGLKPEISNQAVRDKCSTCKEKAEKYYEKLNIMWTRIQVDLLKN